MGGLPVCGSAYDNGVVHMVAYYFAGNSNHIFFIVRTIVHFYFLTLGEAYHFQKITTW